MPNDPINTPDEAEKKPELDPIYLDEKELPKPGTDLKPQTEAEKQAAEQTAKNTVADHQSYNTDIESLNKPASDDADLVATPKKGSIWKELLIWGGITVGIIFVIQNFIFQAFYVSGSSMEPDYHNNDYLIISKQPITWWNIGKLFGQKNMDIQRGDVLVFRYPNAPETFFIKRAIALPGERITIKGGVITIYNAENPDGFVLKEDYIDPRFVTQGTIDEVIEEQHVFVVGDNRSQGGSFDSREWGQLDDKYITGFANFRLQPLSGFGALFRPKY